MFDVRLFLSPLFPVIRVPMGFYPIVQDCGSQISQRSLLYGLLPVLGRGIFAGETYPGLPGVKGFELAGPLIKNT